MLSHLRVLDVTDSGASVAGRILADLGAEVVLVEPIGGVASRRLAPFADDVIDPERSLEFWSRHRAKHSLEIDLTEGEARDQLERLIKASDVWIDDRTFPGLSDPGLSDAGFNAATIEQLNPRMVHALVSPFGEGGPKDDWAATDLTITASSHAMWMTGDADRAPLSCSIPQALLHAGADAASGIMIALAERERSGLGQHIDVSAQVSMMQSSQSGVLANAWNAEPLSRSGGGVGVGDYRLRFVYECADGYVNLTLLFGNPIGHSTGRFFEWMDEEGFSNDALRGEDWVRYGAKFLGGNTTIEAHEAMMDAIERFTRTKTKAELFAAAFERRLLIVPLSDVRDLVESEQLADREFWTPIKHPHYDGEILSPGPFGKFSATPLQVDRAAPTLSDYRERAEALTARPDLTEVPPAPSAGARALPLEGLKVLDFTWVYAGPAVTRQLGDYGATVIKVETSSPPDALRANGPYKDGIPGDNRTANFSNVNLSKQSIGLNLRTPEGVALAKQLIGWADVVIENFSPKAMKNWGLDWESIRADNPDVVMLSSSLSGGTGPQAMLAGYGTMGGALAGFGYITGWSDRRPAAPYMAYTDYVSPRFALAGLLAALDHRKRTGEGQHIDLSQAECSIHFLGAAPLDYVINGRIASAQGNASPHYAPSGVYATEGVDRWIAIATPDDDSWQSLSEFAERGWANDPRFATHDARLANRAALDAEIESWTGSQDRAALEAQLQERAIPSHRVVDSPDASVDPQLTARNHFITVDYGEIGPMPFEASRTRLEATPPIATPCPYLGQHNQEILSNVLGLDDEAITELVIAGAIE